MKRLINPGICPLNSTSQVHGHPLNFLNGIKIQDIIQQIVFIAF